MLINLSPVIVVVCTAASVIFFPGRSQAPFLDLFVHLQYLHSDSSIQ